MNDVGKSFINLKASDSLPDFYSSSLSKFLQALLTPLLNPCVWNTWSIFYFFTWIWANIFLENIFFYLEMYTIL